MIQHTSQLAFDEVKPNRAVRRGAVLAALREGPTTNSEIAERLGWSINRITPRVLELREKGLVELSCRRPCRITGRTAIEWKLAE